MQSSRRREIRHNPVPRASKTAVKTAATSEHFSSYPKLTAVPESLGTALKGSCLHVALLLAACSAFCRLDRLLLKLICDANSAGNRQMCCRVRLPRTHLALHLHLARRQRPTSHQRQPAKNAHGCSLIRLRCASEPSAVWSPDRCTGKLEQPRHAADHGNHKQYSQLQSLWPLTWSGTASRESPK